MRPCAIVYRPGASTLPKNENSLIRSTHHDGQMPIRTWIVQPTLPEYRIPFFSALAERPELAISVHFSDDLPGYAPNAIPDESWRFPFHRHSAWALGNLVWQRHLRQRIRWQPGGVLVISGSPKTLSNYPLLRAARRNRAHIVWWGHGRGANQRRWRLWVRRQLMKFADAWLVYTDQEAEELASCGFPAERVVGLNNTIDQRPIQAARAQWPNDRLARFRESQGLANRPIVIFCSRLMPERRLDWAIRALAQLKTIPNPPILAVIGDGPIKSDLETLAQKEGVAANIRWLGAIHDETHLAPWFSIARAMVFPRHMGLALHHAFGYGLPAITTDCFAALGPEHIALRDGINGMRFADGSIDALAACMHRLISDDDWHQSLSRAAEATVTETYTLPKMVRAFSRAVHVAANQLLASPPG